MKVSLPFDEMLYNTVFIGKQIYHDDGTIHTISHVKLIKDTRQVKIHTVNGEVFLADQDSIIDFEVNEELVNQPTTKKKLKRK